MATISQVTLRRLAGRSVAVLERHKDRQPALGAFVGSLDTDAHAFIEAYDAVMAGTSGRKRRSATGTSAVKELARKARMWLAHLHKDVPNFDRSEFLRAPSVSDDVINDAKRMLAVADEYEQNRAGELPYAEAMRADLEEAIAALHLADQSHTNNRSEFAQMLKTARDAAMAFHQELVAFRRTLAAEVGRKHPDYQRLRMAVAQSGSNAAEEDGEQDTVADDLAHAAGMSVTDGEFPLNDEIDDASVGLEAAE